MIICILDTPFTHSNIYYFVHKRSTHKKNDMRWATYTWIQSCNIHTFFLKTSLEKTSGNSVDSEGALFFSPLTLYSPLSTTTMLLSRCKIKTSTRVPLPWLFSFSLVEIFNWNEKAAALHYTMMMMSVIQPTRASHSQFLQSISHRITLSI